MVSFCFLRKKQPNEIVKTYKQGGYPSLDGDLIQHDVFLARIVLKGNGEWVV